MAEYGENLGINFAAAEDLDTNLYFAVTIADGLIANNVQEATGIILNKPKTGEAVNCGVMGDLPFQAGGAITKGARLTVATSGYITAVNSGDPHIGQALVAVTSGSIGRGIFNFANVTN